MWFVTNTKAIKIYWIIEFYDTMILALKFIYSWSILIEFDSLLQEAYPIASLVLFNLEVNDSNPMTISTSNSMF